MQPLVYAIAQTQKHSPKVERLRTDWHVCYSNGCSLKHQSWKCQQINLCSLGGRALEWARELEKKLTEKDRTQHHFMDSTLKPKYASSTTKNAVKLRNWIDLLMQRTNSDASLVFTDTKYLPHSLISWPSSSPSQKSNRNTILHKSTLCAIPNHNLIPYYSGIPDCLTPHQGMGVYVTKAI